MRIVFVTGGSGFIGRRLIPHLVERGFAVRALCRSPSSAARVAALGAEPVHGDLDDLPTLETGCAGATDVVHCAAQMTGDRQSLERVNVLGTERLLASARQSGTVRRFVFVGAAASLVGRRTVHDANETWPLVELSYFPYAASKARADAAVLAAADPDFVTCSVRPGWVWGNGDPILERIFDAARRGKLAWISGSEHEIVTSHLDNVCHAIRLALERAHTAQAYFVFDDGKVVHRHWLTALLATRGLPAPTRNIPYAFAFSVGLLLETIWRVAHKPGAPPITRAFVRLTGREFTVSDDKARRELGYAPVVSRDEGLRRLKAPRAG